MLTPSLNEIAVAEHNKLVREQSAMIRVRSRKGGTKVHVMGAGSSVAVCGWWTKGHGQRLPSDTPVTCAKCLPFAGL